MFNFSKPKTTQAAVPEMVLKPKSSVNEVIQEIHDTFYTEVGKLLAAAGIANSLDTDKQAMLDKCKRLQALGFVNTKEVQDAKAEILRLDTLKAENEKKAHLTDAINHFAFKYPNYKFITEESVARICKQYGLVYGPITHYTGLVPDKNLKHIEDFAVAEDDACHLEEDFYFGFRGEQSLRKKYKSASDKRKEQEIASGDSEFSWMHRSIDISSRHRTSDGPCPLEIAAPPSDFDMTNMKVENHKLVKMEIPDPIVLKPVHYKGQKHFLIVTAWGLEASDADVVNEKNN